MSGPTVSVVMPAFNASATIDAALASIRGQIHPPDEVIVVDDASSDDTAARAASWNRHLPVTVIRSDVNEGCGRSRTRAVAAATGDVIAPLDADDYWLPDHLATLLPLADDPATIVATQTRRWQPERGIDSSAAAYTTVPPPSRQPTGILRVNFLFSGSLAWRETILAAGGGSAARRADDWEVWIRLIIETGARAVLAPHATVLYRIHAGSLSVLDGCLAEEVELCGRLLADPAYADHADVLRAALRRRLARQEFLDGAWAAHDGDERRARHAFLRALRRDPSLSGGLRPGAIGSVALRSLVGLASPRLTARARAYRLERRSLLACHPAVTSTSPTGMVVATSTNGHRPR